MKKRTIHALYFALLAIWSGLASVAATKPQYGGFSSDAEGRQAYLDYIHSLDMIAVAAGPELRNAVEAIPVEADVALTPAQEAGLHDWLYDFLVAFSSSGSDSLAAAFYLREGVNNPDGVEELKKELEAKGLLKGDTPLAIFQAGHREMLNRNERDYYLEKVSFFDSAFKVSKMQAEYSAYVISLMIHRMVPNMNLSTSTSKLMSEIAEALQAGEQWVFAEVLFIVEDPEEFAGFEGPGRSAFFFRLAWDREKAMWRHVESVYGLGTPYFLFNST